MPDLKLHLLPFHWISPAIIDLPGKHYFIGVPEVSRQRQVNVSKTSTESAPGSVVQQHNILKIKTQDEMQDKT